MRLALGLALVAGPALAVELSLPVACEIGRDCYVQSYADRDPGPGAADHLCGTLSYDGHKGVDIRVPTLADMRRGVDVLAAAPGRVRAVRDGEPDTGHEHFRKGRDCGNAVAITHREEWETLYCHLAEGSVAVAEGDSVARGQVIGRIGLSGRTEFPHLHFEASKHDEVFDPFDGRPLSAPCDEEGAPGLWDREAEIAFGLREARDTAGGLVDMGFAPGPPSLIAIRGGEAPGVNGVAAPALVVWARFYGLSPGHRVSIVLRDPQGRVISESDDAVERNRAELMRYVGRKRPGPAWPPGVYSGEATLTRHGAVIASQRIELDLR